MNFYIDNQLIKPVAIPSSRAPEVTLIFRSSRACAQSFQKFEEDLLNQMDEPLPFETEEDRRLRRNRLAKHLCNQCYQKINQAIIFESDL